MDGHAFHKATVRYLLQQDLDMAERGLELGWTLQGLGMLRKTFFDRSFRLHVWDSRYRALGVTAVHDHPWDFESLVVAGEVRQRRFLKVPRWLAPTTFGGIVMMEQSIVCGEGGGPFGEPTPCLLVARHEEFIGEGRTYLQYADEVHESTPMDGTVTLVRRNRSDLSSTAHVYFRENDRFVSAEARRATIEEVVEILGHSLGVWFTSHVGGMTCRMDPPTCDCHKGVFGR